MIFPLRRFNYFLRNMFHFGFMFDFPYKHSIDFAKKKFGDKKILAAEIGTYNGLTAMNICKSLNIQKIYLIDPYKNYRGYDVGKQYEEKQRNQPDVGNETYMTAKKRMGRFGDKAVFIKKLSHLAVGDVPNNLDFVYVDGNHSYKYCKNDMELYWEKIKKGGILAGHDIVTRKGVMKAFCEFVVEKKLQPIITPTDWILEK